VRADLISHRASPGSTAPESASPRAGLLAGTRRKLDANCPKRPREGAAEGASKHPMCEAVVAAARLGSASWLAGEVAGKREGELAVRIGISSRWRLRGSPFPLCPLLAGGALGPGRRQAPVAPRQLWLRAVWFAACPLDPDRLRGQAQNRDLLENQRCRFASQRSQGGPWWQAW
jgi:hypothetical protein